MTIRSYTAIGDSFTAGTGCAPGEAWPELLARALREVHGDVDLRNLASEGATSSEVERQVGVAREWRSDLITIVFGANDVLGTTRPDIATYTTRLERSLEQLAAPGTRLITATVPERWHFMDLGPRTEARVRKGIESLNAETRRVAAEHGVPCLDVAGHPHLGEPQSFSADGLHPSALGHRRAARGFAALLNHSFGMDLEIDDREKGPHAIAAA